MAGCSNCYFKGVIVGAKGKEDSPFIIIGESPGIMEIALEKPFVGPSGELLDKVLNECGISRLGHEPLFTNALHCHPRKKTPESMVEACIRCHSRLMEEVTKYPRKVILTLGGPAFQSLFNDYNLKITNERGKLFKHPAASIGVIPAVHPAFLLRGAGNYTQFKRDIQYAVDLATEGEKHRKLPNGTTYRIAESSVDVQDIIALLAELDKKKVHISADIETTGFNHIDDKVLCAGIQYSPKESVIVPGYLIVPELFGFKNIKYVWHNGKFDIKFLRKQYKAEARVDEDTMLLSYALNERRGIHDLDQVASDWLGSPNHKGMIDQWTKGKIVDPITGKKRSRNYGDIPPDVLYKYLALDLSDTYHLYNVLRPKVSVDANLEKFYTEHLIPGSEYLAQVEMNGFGVGWDWVRVNDVELTAEQNTYEEEINVWARQELGHNINPRSWQQVKRLLYVKLRLGSTSLGTDKDTLESLPQHDVVKSLLKHRGVSKLKSTYVDGLEDMVASDGRVHPSYLLHGTATSRLSCKDPNLQNIPRKPRLRGQFIPDPGYGILEVDYSQAELRSLAALSGCPDLTEIFNSGKDLHVELSNFLFGLNFTREDKMKAKTVNFGIVYGRTAPSIADAFGVTVAEAQSWIDGWFKRFPKAAEFIERCRMAPLHNETMLTAFGNKKRPGVVGREKLRDIQNESANFPHQSTASNLTVRAGIELITPLREEYDTLIRNTVHDCLVTQTPIDKDHIIKTAKFITDRMEEIPRRYKWLAKVPFKAEPEFGLRWGNLLKFKEIEEKYDWDLTKIPEYVEAH